MADGWTSQMHKGLLELSILALIEKRPSYGYEIVTRLANTPRLAVSEGTVYPILRRLKGQSWLVTYWEESDSGPPRQYYRLSKEGKNKLRTMRKEWLNLVADVNEIVGAESLQSNQNNTAQKSIL